MLKPVQGHCLDGTSISHYLWLEFIKVRYQQLFQVVCVVDKLREQMTEPSVTYHRQK